MTLSSYLGVSNRRLRNLGEYSGSFPIILDAALSNNSIK